MARLYSHPFPFARYRAVRLALLLAGGILCAEYSEMPIKGTALLVIFLGVGYWMLERLFYQTVNPLCYTGATSAYLVLAFLFGLLWHPLNRHIRRPPHINMLYNYRWETVTISGIVYDRKITRTGKQQFDIRVDSTRFGDHLVWPARYNIRAVRDRPLSTPVPLGAGLTASVILYPLPEQRNPYEFDYRTYLFSQDIYIHGGIDTVYTVSLPRRPISWLLLRQQVLDLIEANFSPGNRSLAKALLVGYKHDLTPEERTAFSRAGLAHIMAVSGMHVGFIIAPFWLAIPWFWTLRYGKQTGLVLLILLLLLYSGLTGFSASVCRASITGGLLAYGRLFHKPRDSINLTATAAIILLLIDPRELFRPGFQLSFTAVFAILLILPIIEDRYPQQLRVRWYRLPVTVITVSLVVQAGLLPVLSWYFGEISLIAPAANALVIPWLGIVLPSALLFLAVGSVAPDMGLLLNLPNDRFLDLLQWGVDRGSSMEWSWISFTPDSGWIFPIWYSGLLTIAAVRQPALRWKMLCVSLAVSSLVYARSICRDLGVAPLRVIFFDVGQGDAALITTPGGKQILIDTGRWSPGYTSAQSTLLPYLEYTGVERLHAVILTHPHADHIGGISSLIGRVRIDTIYNSGYPYHSALYESYRNAARQHGIPVVPVRSGMTLAIDPALLLFVYGPAPGRAGSDPNEHSVVVEAIYGETEMLFMGDAGIRQEQRLLDHYGPMLNTDLLKAGHHGSRTGSGSSFLRTATPAVTVVSLDLNNRFGHPHPSAVRRLRAHSEAIYFTSLEKALIFESDGRNLKRTGW